jgi:hypothetical protein
VTVVGGGWAAGGSAPRKKQDLKEPEVVKSVTDIIRERKAARRRGNSRPGSSAV